jgi:hypothetical protein
MSEICLAHLVWEPLGITPFKEFIASYKQNKCGVDHSLLVIFNGFREGRGLEEYYELLEGLTYSSLLLTHPVQDIPAYFAAVQNFQHKYFCFLNSYSVILEQNWLAKMYEHIRREGVGVVGLTGSYESFYSSFLHDWRWKRSKWLYRGMPGIEYNKLRALMTLKRRFPPFPNYHLRSNAFVISRELMLRLKVGTIKEKMDMHEFESGHKSITRQILAMNLEALVVGRDGRAYEKEKWYESFTFRSGEQQNLLVADNQTRRYAESGEENRRALMEAAWGDRGTHPARIKAERL